MTALVTSEMEWITV